MRGAARQLELTGSLLRCDGRYARSKGALANVGRNVERRIQPTTLFK